MKISFDDKSYISFDVGAEPDVIAITIVAIDHNNSRKSIVNSVNLSRQQLDSLVASVMPKK